MPRKSKLDEFSDSELRNLIENHSINSIMEEFQVSYRKLKKVAERLHTKKFIPTQKTGRPKHERQC